jgi:hypothetical protein
MNLIIQNVEWHSYKFPLYNSEDNIIAYQRLGTRSFVLYKEVLGFKCALYFAHYRQEIVIYKFDDRIRRWTGLLEWSIPYKTEKIIL